MILISAHKLEKSFASRTLFENVSFGIEDRDRVGLLGPNGAGKSTILKILTGQAEPDEGNVSRKKNLRVGFLEQTPEFAEGATLLASILEKCEDEGESTARALELMAHLDLVSFDSDMLISKMSGGWRKRVALARELVLDPELLILDEPTNHLDLSGILWLEDYLKDAPFALLMVTHDRLFLQRVCNRIMDLDSRNPNYLLNIKGDYAEYLETKELELASLKRHEQVEKNRLRRETEWLHRGSIARQTKQSARINAAADLKEDVRELRAKNQQKSVDIEFGEAGHSPKKLVEAVGISKAYGERSLFTDLDILLTPKSRLGLLGDNGTGKSTLIKVLLGLEKPDSGSVKIADKIEVAYFEQGRETLEPSKSVLKNLCPEGDYVFFQGQSIHIRSYLDRFYFSGHKAEMPVVKLSGGEQARLRIAQLMLKQSQVLVLDEPTNDLDTDTLNSLEESLKGFNGAVILVTHDRYFLDAVANQILAFPKPTDSNQSLQKFSSYFQWENWYTEEQLKARQTQKQRTENKSGAPKSKLSFKEKFELENIEGEISKLEQDLNDLTERSSDPETIKDHKKLAQIHSQLAAVQSAIEQKYTRWTELEAKK